MTDPYPPTVVVVHDRENRKKCSVEPLRGRPNFVFVNFPSLGGLPDLTRYVRLSIEGPPLGPNDENAGLLVLDATWRLEERMTARFADIAPRSLPRRWTTAYPRVSKVFDDPADGLATIEAIYAAYVALDRPVDGLLDDYRWAEQFLELNHVPLRKAP